MAGTIDEKLLEVMACPKCKGGVELKDGSVVCGNCALKYRIEDGIPVMLIDEAESL